MIGKKFSFFYFFIISSRSSSSISSASPWRFKPIISFLLNTFWIQRGETRKPSEFTPQVLVNCKVLVVSIVQVIPHLLRLYFSARKPRYFTSISSNYDNLTWKFFFFALFFSLPFRYFLKYRTKLYYSILVPMNLLRVTSYTKKAFCDNIHFYLSSMTLSSQSLQTQYHTFVGLSLVIVSPTLIPLFLSPFLAPLAVVTVDTKADATANATTVTKTNMISNKL